MPLKTNIYVDGFNLYYGGLKGTHFKWLDIAKLCELLLPNNRINQIRYFTAPVIPRPHDPQQRSRQELYWRALRTIPNLTIIEGQFLVKKVWMMKADLSEYVQIIKTEEKGTDVNLASYLLADAYEGNYEIAVVVSNDSDLAYPITYVKNILGKGVGLINPHPNPSFELMKNKTFYKKIRPAVLAASQFPESITDGKGIFQRPAAWLGK